MCRACNFEMPLFVPTNHINKAISFKVCVKLSLSVLNESGRRYIHIRMGGNQSNLIPMPAGFDYMSVTFRYSDRIRVIYATDQEINIIQDVILQHWKKGIQSEEAKLGCGYEFKVHGNPFCEFSSAEQAMECRKFTNQLLFRLHNQGLKLLASSDLSQTVDLASWLFHREQTQIAQFPFACIGVSGWDKLQFIDFPPAFNDFFKDVVAKNWPQTIQDVKLKGDILEIKLKGTPWCSMGGPENIQSKTLVKALINELGVRQWFLYGSSNLRGNADTLFFMYDPAAPSVSFSFVGFVMSLNRNDRLRMIDAPKDATDSVRGAIAQFWSRGIQEEKQKFNAYEFKLKGTPWWADGEQAVDTRFLMCKVFEALLRIGWKVKISIDLTRKLNDKSVLPFQKCEPSSAPVFCISLNWTDKIRFINAPPDLLAALVAEVKRVWLFGVSRERLYGASTELKLNENPWSYGFKGHDGAHGRVMLSYLCKLCANMGWYLILSADVSAKWVHQDKGPDYPIDVHSWWFMYMGHPSMAPIAPAFLPPPQYGMEGQLPTAFGAGLPPPPYS